MADTSGKKVPQKSSPWLTLQGLQNMIGETPIKDSSYLYKDTQQVTPSPQADPEKARLMMKGFWGR